MLGQRLVLVLFRLGGFALAAAPPLGLLPQAQRAARAAIAGPAAASSAASPSSLASSPMPSHPASDDVGSSSLLELAYASSSADSAPPASMLFYSSCASRWPGRLPPSSAADLPVASRLPPSWASSGSPVPASGSRPSASPPSLELGASSSWLRDDPTVGIATIDRAFGLTALRTRRCGSRAGALRFTYRRLGLFLLPVQQP